MTTNLDAATWERVMELLAAKDQPSGLPHPDYVGLRAVFQEPCYHQSAAIPQDTKRGELPFYKCHACGQGWRVTGAGFREPDVLGVVSRLLYWQAADNGALNGAIDEFFCQRGEKDHQRFVILRSVGLTRLPRNINQAALDAILAWLEEA